MKVAPTFTEEFDKVLALNGANDVIGEFLEWLPQGNLVLCDADTVFESTGHFTMTYRGIARILAEYFGIDERGFAHEKEMAYRLIRWMRSQEEDGA